MSSGATEKNDFVQNKGATMKSAVYTVPRESKRPDSDLAIVPAVNVVIQLPQPSQPAIDVHNGQTVQWHWSSNFSVNFKPGGVFQPPSIQAVEQPDGSYLTPHLRVIGPPRNVTNCTYTSLPDAIAADADPPPPPPPNVVIVDNSIFPCATEK